MVDEACAGRGTNDCWERMRMRSAMVQIHTIGCCA